MTSGVRLLRACDRAATPWKNGLGLTRQIAVSPAGASLDSFEWRISMASVHQGGPFSNFPGVDRWLAVLSGRLVLTVGDRPAVEVGPGTPRVAFPGDVPVEARLLAGTVTDLNLLTGRDLFDVSFERVAFSDPVVIGGKQTVVLLTETAGLGISYGGRSDCLSALDAVMLESGRSGSLRLEPGSRTVIHVIRLTRKPSKPAYTHERRD